MELRKVKGPASAETLQQVLDTAEEDDVIQLEPGTYPGPVVIRSAVTLMGALGAAHTIIDAGGRGSALVVEGDAVSATLCGLTARNGASAMGAGLALFGCHEITVLNCIFENNHAADVGGGGLYASAGLVRLRDTVFRGNQGLRGGALLLDDAALVVAVNCVFVGNEAHFGGAVRLKDNVVFSALHCSFADNRTWVHENQPGRGGVLYASAGGLANPRVMLANSIIWSAESDSLYNEPGRPTGIEAQHSIVPSDWKDTIGLTTYGDVIFGEVERRNHHGLPALRPEAEGTGLGNWTLMLLGDATNDYLGHARLDDERVDPGAMQAR